MSNRSVGKGLLWAGQRRAGIPLHLRTAVCLSLQASLATCFQRPWLGAELLHTALPSALRVTTELVAGIKGAINFPLNRAMSFFVCALCKEENFVKYREQCRSQALAQGCLCTVTGSSNPSTGLISAKIKAAWSCTKWSQIRSTVHFFIWFLM